MGEGSGGGFATEEGFPGAGHVRRELDHGPHIAKGMVPMIRKKEPQARIDLFFMFKPLVHRRIGASGLKVCSVRHVRRW